MEQKKLSNRLKIMDLPQEERPRERLIKCGTASLSDSELIAIILGKGTKSKNVLELSQEILSKFSIEAISEQPVNNLCKIRGIGIAKACQLAACFELGRRLASCRKKESPNITCAEDIFSLL